jgi:hypothetical protein
MVVIGVCILRFQNKAHQTITSFPEWTVLSLGGVAIFFSFIWEYTKIVIQGGFIPRFFSLGEDAQFQDAMARHIPGSYNWPLFAIGECMILCFLIMLYRRAGSGSKPSP